ncbi:hypothetical protein TNCV_425991 [Trichonephila clavipes]|nr:hypothetical protein TNCV_425991 [Trichonephila clavipes]
MEGILREDWAKIDQEETENLAESMPQSLREVIRRRGDHGSLMVKVTDSWLACHEFEPSTDKDPPCGGAMHIKFVESSNVLPLVWYGR